MNPEVNLPDPPVIKASDAAAATRSEANDVVMAEDNVQPEATLQTEAPDTTEDIQPSTSDVATAPTVPHTMARAFNREGELISVKWPVLTPPETPGPQYEYHIQQRPQT